MYSVEWFLDTCKTKELTLDTCSKIKFEERPVTEVVSFVCHVVVLLISFLFIFPRIAVLDDKSTPSEFEGKHMPCASLVELILDENLNCTIITDLYGSDYWTC